MSVRYEKRLRETAKELGLHPITIDVPGFSYQFAGTDEQVRDVHELFQKWMKQKPKTVAEDDQGI